jgi:hypothetical protein
VKDERSSRVRRRIMMLRESRACPKGRPFVSERAQAVATGLSRAHAARGEPPHLPQRSGSGLSMEHVYKQSVGLSMSHVVYRLTTRCTIAWL